MIKRKDEMKTNKKYYLQYYCYLAIILFLLFLVGCKAPMNYAHPSSDLSYIKKVAVAPIINLTNDKFAGEKVMNVVATEILRRGAFDVIEFGEVAKVLREEGLKRDNLVSKHIAERAGKRLGVEAIVLGSVMQYGVSRVGSSSFPEVSISLKLVDVNSYSILWEATHNVKGKNILEQLFGIRKDSLEDICQKTVKETLDTLFGSQLATK